ncbi:MAG: MBL fold metallo-hydrolase [Pseudomonadales bacterium]|nr:MBL fold metallo-hydrolase [Pseudomonadales bacterium]
MRIASRPTSQLSLSNPGQLELYFIGTGAAFAKTLNQNNLVVTKGDAHLLVDCGTKCSQSLHEIGLPISRIQNFLITHSHADHIGGLEEVQLHARFVEHRKPTMIINEEYEEILWDQSLRGGSERSEMSPLTFADLWQIIRPERLEGAPRETWHARLGDIDIKMPRTMHFPDTSKSWADSQWSCGVILDDRVLFTSDTRFDRDLLETFDDVYDFDVIFHDCQLFRGGVHASLDELVTLPDRLKAKTMLMHYGDEWQKFRQYGLDNGFMGWAEQGHSYSFD